MPPVDMSQAYDALARVQEFVKGYGLDILPRDMVRLVLLARSLAIFAAVNQAYYGAAPTGIIGPVRCSPEMALFCLTEQSVHSPKLKRVLQGLQYTHDAHNDYLAITTKKPDPIILELAARRINGLPVLEQHPMRILRSFINQKPLEILIKAIKHVGPPTKMVVGWGAEPHRWQVVN